MACSGLKRRVEFSANTRFRRAEPLGLLLVLSRKSLGWLKPDVQYVEKAGLKSLFRNTKKRSFRSSRVANFSQLLTTSLSQRRRLRDASLATAWPLSRKTVTNKAHALAASADRHIRPHGILTYASGLQSHAQWGTGASRRAAPCDDSWAGLMGTLTSRASRPVRTALERWAPLRGCIASRIV
eukprot:365326-Chlamydomonas_euryale.AAC.19